jgi:peroxidase
MSKLPLKLIIGLIYSLPAPTSSLQQLLSAYNKKNLNPTDMVALSGAYIYAHALIN